MFYSETRWLLRQWSFCAILQCKRRRFCLFIPSSCDLNLCNEFKSMTRQGFSFKATLLCFFAWVRCQTLKKKDAFSPVFSLFIKIFIPLKFFKKFPANVILFYVSRNCVRCREPEEQLNVRPWSLRAWQKGSSLAG